MGEGTRIIIFVIVLFIIIAIVGGILYYRVYVRPINVDVVPPDNNSGLLPLVVVTT